MKHTCLVLGLCMSLLLGACEGNTDTSTDMPDSGYQMRDDALNSNPVLTDEAPAGAVRSDSVFNGHTGVSGVTDSAGSNMDSAQRK